MLGYFFLDHVALLLAFYGFSIVKIDGSLGNSLWKRREYPKQPKKDACLREYNQNEIS